ncbi:MAG: hypothetical protein SGPRY_013571, partial [Prymnesium sp.]
VTRCLKLRRKFPHARVSDTPRVLDPPSVKDATDAERVADRADMQRVRGIEREALAKLRRLVEKSELRQYLDGDFQA